MDKRFNDDVAACDDEHADELSEMTTAQRVLCAFWAVVMVGASLAADHANSGFLSFMFCFIAAQLAFRSID